MKVISKNSYGTLKWLPQYGISQMSHRSRSLSIHKEFFTEISFAKLITQKTLIVKIVYTEFIKTLQSIHKDFIKNPLR